jgi:hypothetical protein
MTALRRRLTTGLRDERTTRRLRRPCIMAAEAVALTVHRPVRTTVVLVGQVPAPGADTMGRRRGEAMGRRLHYRKARSAPGTEPTVSKID